MAFPIIRSLKIGEIAVEVKCDKELTSDNRTVLSCVATVGPISHEEKPISYEEKWSLPHDNHEYSQEQAQKDFDAHVEKVARLCLGRSVAHRVSENLK